MGGEQGFCGVKIPSSFLQASSPFAPGVRLERLRPQLRKVKEFPYTGWLGWVNYTKKGFVICNSVFLNNNVLVCIYILAITTLRIVRM